MLVAHADLLPQIARGIPKGVKVFVVPTPELIAHSYDGGAGSRPLNGYQDWNDVVAGAAPWDKPAEPQTSSMIYTSGTTGRQKGVRRDPSTPEQFQRTIETARKVMGIAPGIRSIIPAPMYHSAPNFFAVMATVAGGFTVIMPRFDPEEFLRLVEKHKITHVQMVPVMFVRLLKLPKEVREKYDVSSLRNIIHAAAPCPADVKKAMIAWWGPVINEYYGSTELGILTYATSEEALKTPGTVGKAIDDVSLKILNADGTEAPAGQPGMVYARVNWYPDFTYQHDAEKRKAMEREGLLSPGDIGYLNEDGYLFLCDRSNDMVISGGVNIYPAEIESELIQLDGVKDCAVFGIPDEEFGEALAAIIEPQDGAALTEADVAAYLRDRLAHFKVPKHIEFRSDLPREDSGKLFKRKLREPFWEKAGRKI
jgi:long-chain acyl-CoA synthetase